MIPPCRRRSTAIDPARQRAILEALGFGVTEGTPSQIAVPSWRRDMDAAPGRGRRK